MTDKVDHKAFFEKWGAAEAATNWFDIGAKPDQEMTAETFLAAVDVLTVEELYQAFEARILAKLQAQKVVDWGFDK